jgi:xanthine/CO dehydrogenase XdhC/CoxF family maturation factor
MMARTAAQRQAAYRANRHSAGTSGNGERRLNTWLSTEASLALARLAKRYGVTQRQILERFITAEDDRILATLEPGTPEWDVYFQPK